MSVQLWERVGDRIELGKALVELSHVRLWALDPDNATGAGLRSVEVLEEIGPSPALATAYANVAFVQAMRSRYPEAAESGRRGAALAARFGRDAVRAYAMAQHGAALLLAGEPAGREILLAALAESRRTRAHEYVSMCCTWLVVGLTRLGRVDEIETYLDLGVRYSDEHEVRVGVTQLRVLRCELALRRGQLQPAEEQLRELGGGGIGTGWGEHVAVSLLGRVLTRRGDPQAGATVHSAWELAMRAGDVLRVGPAGIALAEWAWTTGRDQEVRAELAHALDVVRRRGHAWFLGELLRYHALAFPGQPVPAADVDLDERWAAGLRGDWQAAADGWERTGWPFERAQELSESGDQVTTLGALAEFDRLQARGTADRVRRMLREQGVGRVPRGPLPRTRRHPAGLTARQFEVVNLMAASLTNAEIAERLVVSVRTVDHHVSAIFEKLGVRTRRAAVERIRALAAAEPSSETLRRTSQADNQRDVPA